MPLLVFLYTDSVQEDIPVKVFPLKPDGMYIPVDPLVSDSSPYM